MKIKNIFLLILLTKISSQCRMSFVKNFKPVEKPPLSVELQKAEICFEEMIEVKQDIKRIIYLILTNLNISELTASLLKISQNARKMLDNCQDVKVPDLINYLLEHLNNDGKVCIRNITRVGNILLDLFFLYMDTPIVDLIEEIKTLVIDIKEIAFYCPKIDFDVQI
jgi:hypothetical protein